MPANSLTLFKVPLYDDAIDTTLLSLDLANCPSLEPFSRQLSSFFDSAPNDHLHILVKQPRGESNETCVIKTNLQIVTEPNSCRSLYTIDEEARLMCTFCGRSPLACD